MRKYPVGIQSFEKIRSEGYVYVDKTALVYKMITNGCPYFLSRPRRFGKSLLVNTLAAVFEGRRELFEAFTTKQGIEQPQLFIATTDWEWERYPVLRFDFSKSNLTSIEKLDKLIDTTLAAYEQQYGAPAGETDTSIRMTNIIHAAEREMGKKVVVLVDEYDNMMLHSLGDPQMRKLVSERFQDLFTPLKGEDDHLQFVFITGISKFSPKGIYILELKYDDTADNALRQMDERGYASKYALDGRPIVKVGLAFSSKERNIMEWKIEL